MINALLLAMEFQGMMPEAQKPEHTEGREGFIHLEALEGSVEHASSDTLFETMILIYLRKKRNICRELPII